MLSLYHIVSSQWFLTCSLLWQSEKIQIFVVSVNETWKELTNIWLKYIHICTLILYFSTKHEALYSVKRWWVMLNKYCFASFVFEVFYKLKYVYTSVYKKTKPKFKLCTRHFKFYLFLNVCFHSQKSHVEHHSRENFSNAKLTVKSSFLVLQHYYTLLLILKCLSLSPLSLPFYDTHLCI